MVRNNLKSLHGDLTGLTNLRVLNCRYNKLLNGTIPAGLFNLNDLTVLVRHPNYSQSLQDSVIKFLNSAAVFTKFCASICQILRQYFSTQTSKIYTDSYMIKKYCKIE